MRVLIVDDSAAMRNIIMRCLETLQVTNVAEACDGQEAWTLFQTGGFDLILSDWSMPHMNGLELLIEVRRQDPDIPFLMITSESDRARVVSAIQAGVSDYVVKPLNVNALKHKLENWITVES